MYMRFDQRPTYARQRPMTLFGLGAPVAPVPPTPPNMAPTDPRYAEEWAYFSNVTQPRYVQAVQKYQDDLAYEAAQARSSENFMRADVARMQGASPTPAVAAVQRQQAIVVAEYAANLKAAQEAQARSDAAARALAAARGPAVALAAAGPRAGYSGQLPGETDEQFFARMRASQLAAAQAMQTPTAAQQAAARPTFRQSIARAMYTDPSAAPAPIVGPGGAPVAPTAPPPPGSYEAPSSVAVTPYQAGRISASVASVQRQSAGLGPVGPLPMAMSPAVAQAPWSSRYGTAAAVGAGVLLLVGGYMILRR